MYHKRMYRSTASLFHLPNFLMVSLDKLLEAKSDARPVRKECEV